MTTTPQRDGAPSEPPDVANLGLVRPPFIYLISILSGTLIQLAVPVRFLPVTIALPVGAALVAVAIVLFSYSVARFRASGTPLPARKPTTAIVRTGPYRFSGIRSIWRSRCFNSASRSWRAACGCSLLSPERWA
jgi:hypothetical protein